MTDFEMQSNLELANIDMNNPTLKKHAEKCGIDMKKARDLARRELEEAGIDWRQEQ